jgi:hypothetical protein
MLCDDFPPAFAPTSADAQLWRDPPSVGFSVAGKSGWRALVILEIDLAERSQPLRFRQPAVKPQALLRRV